MQYQAPLWGHHLLLLQEVGCLFEILCYSWVFTGEIKSKIVAARPWRPSLCPDTWKRHLEPCALQEISEVNALSCLILLGLYCRSPHSFPSSDMTQECRTVPWNYSWAAFPGIFCFKWRSGHCFKFARLQFQCISWTFKSCIQPIIFTSFKVENVAGKIV